LKNNGLYACVKVTLEWLDEGIHLYPHYFISCSATHVQGIWKANTRKNYLKIQRDPKVSVHLMVTMPYYLAQSHCLAAERQGQGQEDTRLTLTPSVIPNSNYVIMISDWNCLKYFCFLL
jgi:hypothetical protein